MKKLPAFTMIELLVTIVISSIVIGFALGIYYQVNGYFSKNSRQQEDINKIVTFQSVLYNDMEIAKEVYCLSDRITLTYRDNLITYKFYDEYLTRETMHHTDTFFILVTGLSSEKLDSYSDFAKEITFLVENGDTPWQFRYFKQYTRDVLFSLSQKKN